MYKTENFSFASHAIISYQYKFLRFFTRQALILMSVSVSGPGGPCMIGDNEIMEAIRKRTGRHVIKIEVCMI